METSPYKLCMQLEGQLKRLLAGQDASTLPPDVRPVVTSIKRIMAEARLDVRDYEYAETRAEQQQHGSDARKRLERVRQAVLTASEYNVFSAIDVAHTTATIEQITKHID